MSTQQVTFGGSLLKRGRGLGLAKRRLQLGLIKRIILLYLLSI